MDLCGQTSCNEDSVQEVHDDFATQASSCGQANEEIIKDIAHVDYGSNFCTKEIKANFGKESKIASINEFNNIFQKEKEA